MKATLQTDRFAMDYCRFGEGPRQMLILPGLSLTPVVPLEDLLKNILRKFLPKYTVYVFDRRKDPPEGYSMRDLAEDIAEACFRLGLKDLYLFGSSQGGMAALFLAGKYPELVRKMALGSASIRTTEGLYRNISEWIRLAKEKKKYELNASILKDIHSSAVYASFKQEVFDAGNAVTDRQLQEFIVMADGLLHFDFSEEVKKIVCGVFVLGSEGDKVTGVETSREMMKELNCGGYIYGPEYGHAVYDEAPDYYSEKVFGFFEDETLTV